MTRAYIFDQDGTLYPQRSTLSEKLTELTKEWIVRELRLEPGAVESFYKALQEKFPNPLDGFGSLGLTPGDYHANVFEKVDPASYLSRDDKLAKILNSIKQPKFVVTFASRNYSAKLQEALGINGLLQETVLVSDFYPATSKSDAYLSVSKKLGMKNREICVVGNNFHTDILPAMNHGFDTILIGGKDEGCGGIVVPSIHEISAFLT